MSNEARYEIDRVFCDTEEDTYENGCLPGTGTNFMITVRLSAATIEDLIRGLFEEIGVKQAPDAVELDACDEDGRIDIQCMNDADNSEASSAELELWRAGKVKLWSANYTAHVQKVTRETVALRGLK